MAKKNGWQNDNLPTPPLTMEARILTAKHARELKTTFSGAISVAAKLFEYLMNETDKGRIVVVRPDGELLESEHKIKLEDFC